MSETARADGGTEGAEERRDVVVVGGGPAGCAAAVFTARYGLDTVVFDRGPSSIRRCGYLENYLGFPAGIDIETFVTLAHDHVEQSGGDVVADTVESVERADGGFRVATADGRVVRAERVVAAAKYGGDPFLGLDEDAVEVVAHDGEKSERFDSAYADREGRTPTEGFYVAGPLAGVRDQALVAAGHGAGVGCAIVEDVRREAGYWEAVAAYYDWVRREENLTGEWAEREHWREYLAADAPEDVDEETFERVCEAYVDERFAQYRSPEERERLRSEGHERLAEYLDVE
ncbi:FAD-dependent oxidoreductase (plasmid) [Halarchaeum sp. CBA1220]|uniref:FAD-dependent oxidoreductase n=1 Tax=Halarchaeum sp. CBA1220 TaxID=1853682 RepID=UPI000F3A91BD|nr:FAD-dependent oxidoreductase [Halarchaeum sp. CBA1220]QLC34750.1 FAD-dependent oxidoreductase [Halarchaeum sp. CBA1220]